MFLSFLGVVCVMLATVGLMYLYIALRTHLDRSLLHFSVTLLLICGVAAIDVGIQPWRKGPEGSVFWLKQQHVLFCAIVPMLYSYLLRLTGEKWSRSLKLLALSTILLAPFFLYGDAMLYRDGDVNGATWLYRWVFLPLYVLYSGVALWLLIRGIRTSRSRERRVLATHLVGLTGLALFAGADVFLTSSAEIAAVPGFTIFGTLLFGVSTTVVFGDRLLGLVNDRRRAYAKLERAYRELEAASALSDLGRSAAFINHEVKNNLFAVSAGLQVLLRSEQLSESGQGRLKSVERTVDRLTRFSQDILTLSAGQLEIAKGPVNVSDLFQQSAARLWPDQTEVALTCEIDEDLEVAGDATKLEQVVDNLLLNAFEAGASRVWVSATVGPASVLIKVEDDGPGCPPAELEDLFRAFYTTKSRATGAGLGLSLVKAIIESHGGRVSAYSKTLTGQTDHGLIVLLTLPLPDAKGPVGGITLVKAGMPEVGRVIRVLQNVSVAPRIAETPAEIDPDSGAVLVSDDTASRCWPDLTQSGRLHLLSLEEDALLVTAGGRKPQLFSEEYVLRELLPEPQGA